MAELPTNQAASAGPEKERVVPESEKALAGSWDKKIKAAKSRQKEMTAAPANLKKLREYVNGKQHDDGASGLVRTNLVFATLASLLPYVYAKNPDISVRPTEAVEQGQYEAVKKFCRTLEIVLRRMMVFDGKLKKRAKSAVRAAMTTGIGWVKVTYQRDYQTDPIIQNRIADIQDNLQRLKYLTAEVESGNAGDEEAKKAELEQQVNALQAKVEVVVAEGVVIDKILTEDMLVLDESIRDFDMYPQSRALAHRVWFSKEAYKETFGGACPSGATIFKRPIDDDGGTSAENTQEFVAVWEIWDRISQSVYTKCEGSAEFSRAPYQPDKLGERWYPFFAVGFNLVDGQFEPLNDVELMKELQDEYNTTRTNFAEHRKENIPGTVVRAGGSLDEKDVQKIVNRKINETIVVGGDANVPLSNELVELNGNKIDPLVYDVTPIRNDLDMVVGMSDASRSNLMKPKTLGEAEIMRDGMMSRTSERQDSVEDFLQEMAQYVAEILLQELTLQQVQQIAGIAATWPQMSKDGIFNLVSIDIRAGSTGKPNKQQEREQWISFLPQFQETVGKIVELRAQGHVDMAQSLIELLKETLRRFDERLDIDLYVPKDDQQSQVGQLTKMLQEGKQRLDQLEQEVATLKPAADANQTKIQIADQDRNTEIYIEEKRIDSNERIEMAKLAQPVPVDEPPPIAEPTVADEPAAPAPEAEPKPTEDEALQKVMAQFESAMQNIARAMTADRIPVRDGSGRIERMRADLQTNA